MAGAPRAGRRAGAGAGSAAGMNTIDVCCSVTYNYSRLAVSKTNAYTYLVCAHVYIMCILLVCNLMHE